MDVHPNRITLLNDILNKLEVITEKQNIILEEIVHIKKEINGVRAITNKLPERKNGWLGSYWELKNEKNS